MRKFRTLLLLVVVVCCCLELRVASPQFLPEERVTPLDGRNYEMTRNPNHSMAVGRDGTVHLVFWDGSLETSTSHPSTVWYCRRDPAGCWSRPEVVDDSYTSQGKRIGGRHPSLVLRSNGEVRVFWHDYRNCTSSRKWIDNIELYTDSRPPLGSFSRNDLRLTTTSAAHDGDNGYVPQAVAAPSGEIFAAWYDYHFNRSLADIFLMKSNALGRFPSLPIDFWRLTNITQRGDGVSYTLPDLALDSSNTVHLVWTTDNLAGRRVYYAHRDPGGTLSTPVVLSPLGGDFYDPPHITAAPRGDIYAIWTDHGSFSNTSIYAARLRPGLSAFDPPMRVTSNAAVALQGDAKVDSLGFLHVVWTDRRAGNGAIFYGVFDPDRQILLSESKISEGSADSVRPCIALSERRRAYLVWTDYRHGNGQIYFRTNEQLSRAGAPWNLYR